MPLSDLERGRTEQLPTWIAAPYSRALSAPHGIAALHALTYTYQMILKTSACWMLSELTGVHALEDPARARITRRLEELSRPHPDDWLAVMNVCAPMVRGVSIHPILNAAAASWKSIRRNGVSVHERIRNLRNTTVGHGAPLAAERARSLRNEAAALLELALQHFAPIIDLRLVVTASDGSLRLLQGEQVGGTPYLGRRPGTAMAWFATDRGSVEAHPLVWAGGLGPESGDVDEPALGFDGVRGDCGIAVGAFTEQIAIRPLFTAWRAFVGRLAPALAPAASGSPDPALRARAHAHMDDVAQQLGWDADMAPAYVARNGGADGIDDALQTFLCRRIETAVHLSAEAGAGKTAALLNLATGCARGTSVLWLTARTLLERGSAVLAIGEALGLATNEATLALTQLVTALYDRNSSLPVVVIIDGVDEAPHPVQAISLLKSLISEARAHNLASGERQVVVLFACRTSVWAWAVQATGWTPEEPGLAKFGASGEPFLALRPFSEAEAANAWERLVTSLGRDAVVTATNWRALSAEVRECLREPMLARLWLESGGATNVQSTQDIWAAWLASQMSDETVQSLILAIAAPMLDQGVEFPSDEWFDRYAAAGRRAGTRGIWAPDPVETLAARRLVRRTGSGWAWYHATLGDALVRYLLDCRHPDRSSSNFALILRYPDVPRTRHAWAWWMWQHSRSIDWVSASLAHATSREVADFALERLALSAMIDATHGGGEILEWFDELVGIAGLSSGTRAALSTVEAFQNAVDRTQSIKKLRTHLADLWLKRAEAGLVVERSERELAIEVLGHACDRDPDPETMLRYARAALRLTREAPDGPMWRMVSRATNYVIDAMEDLGLVEEARQLATRAAAEFKPHLAHGTWDERQSYANTLSFTLPLASTLPAPDASLARHHRRHWDSCARRAESIVTLRIEQCSERPESWSASFELIKSLDNLARLLKRSTRRNHVANCYWEVYAVTDKAIRRAFDTFGIDAGLHAPVKELTLYARMVRFQLASWCTEGELGIHDRLQLIETCVALGQKLSTPEDPEVFSMQELTALRNEILTGRHVPHRV